MLAYARKQSQSTIFEWVEKDKEWLWHAGDYPPGWEKKVKVINTPMPSKKSSAKPKSTKKGGDSFEAFSGVVPFESGLPTISNVVLESPPPASTNTHSNVRPTANKPKFTTPRSSTNAPRSSRTRGSKRKTFPFPAATSIERRVCYL